MIKIESDNSWFIDLVQASEERRDLEFKSGFIFSTKHCELLQAELIKSIVAMTNTPGGGVIIVGVEEDTDQKPLFVGLTAEQKKSFSNYENVKGYIQRYAQRTLEYNIKYWQYQENVFITFHVSEFAQLPVLSNLLRVELCNKPVLEVNTLYTRNSKPKYGDCKPDAREWEEIMELSATKIYRQRLKMGYALIHVDGNNESVLPGKTRFTNDRIIKYIHDRDKFFSMSVARSKAKFLEQDKDIDGQ